MHACLVITSALSLLLSLALATPSPVHAQSGRESQLAITLADLEHAPDDPQARLIWIDERIQWLHDERPTPRTGRIMIVGGAASAVVGLGVGVVGLLMASPVLRLASPEPSESRSNVGPALMGAGGILIAGGLLSLVAGGLAAADARYRARRHDDAVSLLRREREVRQSHLDLSIRADRHALAFSWRIPL